MNFAGVLETTVLANANVTTTGAGTANSGELDTQPLEGTAILTVSDRASGTAAATVAVLHSDTSGSGYAAVPADALFDLDTGEASAFASLSTSASMQSRGLHLQKLRRYVIVQFAGTDIDHEVCVVATGYLRSTV